MSLLARTLHLLAVVALGLPALAHAQDAASQPTPKRRAADPALVRTLQGNVWTLQSANDPASQPIDALTVPGQAFVLRFDGARLAVQGGCNNMSGSWRLSPQAQLRVSRLAATMKACEPALMTADVALASLLAQPLDVQLQPGATPILVLVSPTKQVLILDGKPTLQSLYGAPKRIFLEVAAQTVPCQPGAGTPTQCLQVRERRFDKQGVGIEPSGEWGAFYGAIDGYTHTPGVRNVLRIDRYQRKQVPADASRYLYVLDLVVESETVSK